MRQATVNCWDDSSLAPDGADSITLYSFHLAYRGLYYMPALPPLKNKYQHVCVFCISVWASKRGFVTVYVRCYVTDVTVALLVLFLPSQE